MGASALAASKGALPEAVGVMLSLLMNTRNQIALTATATAFSLALLAAPAPAAPAPKPVVNTASAQGTVASPTWTTALSWQVTPASGPLATTNTATTLNSNCVSIPTATCNTMAAAFQVVEDSHASQALPPATTDTATAHDTNCFGCAAYAFAEQWVLQSTGTVKLTAAGTAALEQEHTNLEALLASPDPQVLTAQAQYFEQDISTILSTDVVTSPPGAQHWYVWDRQVSIAAD